ncbi:MAG: ATP-dependent DNA ligase, partial [Candidatus Nanohaloarchaea archaeon]|nr:ATP-dependent DNA ligase [Candidatus Nanohaloarchaea archaeon]
GLGGMEMELFRPVKVMLAQKVESMEDGFDTVGDEDCEAALEYKYDGFRVQIHKKGEEVKVFSRRLEDVTEQFPDIVKAVKESIIEGERVAYDPEDNSMVPFQKLSKRIKRKYDIQEMVEKIPVTVYLFDTIQMEGEVMIDEPQRERWKELKETVEEEDWDLELAHHIETSDLEEARKFYQKALNQGQEGIMLKNLDARYKPGSRVGYMVKLKPVMETLDLVIVEADWGEGRRSDWLGSYLLACREEETGDLKTVGKMATGFTDEQLEEMTQRLEPLVVESEGRHVELKPEVVVEVAYEEIQESPKYESGYALRFPRLVQVREDMDPEEANELGKVENLYESQQG